jgi:tetratricopeptide (TPR) repeat protein
MAQAAGIFISHAHEDNSWCRAFVQALRNAGADVWYDEHNLGFGVLSKEIEGELKARPIFIVILSPLSVTKPWVEREVSAAIALQDQDPARIILPVVAEKTEIPLFWQSYKRVSGAGDAGLTAVEAAGRVVHTLAIMPAGMIIEPAPPVTSETAVAASERGDGLYAQHRNEEALAAYERAVVLDPEVAKYWSKMGSVLGSLDRNEEALAATVRAIALDPEVAEYWRGKGITLESLKYSEVALEAYERASALEPGKSLYWSDKARILTTLNRPEEAMAAFDQALTLDPQDWYSRYEKDRALFDRAIALLDLNRLEEALAAIEQATAPNGGLVQEALVVKGSVLYELERYKEACETFEHAIAVLNAQDSLSASAWNGKGNALNQLKNYAAALAAYEQALAIEPQLAVAWTNKIALLRQLGRTAEADEAERQWDKAMKEAERQQAAAQSQQVITIDPRSATAYDQRIPPPEPVAPGDRVDHRLFGKGVVLKVRQSADITTVEVLFDGRGRKSLDLAYAGLQKVDQSAH